MITVGLVLTVVGPTVPEALAADPRLLVGDRVGDRLPLAFQVEAPPEDEQVLEWVSSLPGICHAEVAFAEFSAPEEAP